MIQHRYDMTIPTSHPNRSGVKSDKLDLFIVHYTANDNLGATDIANAKYFGRAFKLVNGKYYEADGKTKFRYGCTNKIIDYDSVCTVIPIGEYTPNAGDRPLNYYNGYKGQTAKAKEVDYRQNYRSTSYELCNNDNWLAVVDNAVEEIARDMVEGGLPKSEIQVLRHGDLTGKNCPRAFMEDEAAWADFRDRLWRRYDEIKSLLKPTKVVPVNGNITEEIRQAIELILAKYEAAVTTTSDKIMTLSEALDLGIVSQEATEHVYMTVYGATKLNFRSGPVVKSGNILDGMVSGSKVYPTGRISSDKKWIECYYKDLKGWAYAQYLKQ